MSEANDWKQNPLLKGMNKEKLDYLTNLSTQMKSMNKDQLLPAFAAMQMEATKKGMNFTDQETELLVSVLSANMSPAEKKRMETLRTLANKMAARKS